MQDDTLLDREIVAFPQEIHHRQHASAEEFENDIKYFFEHMDEYQDRLRKFIGTELHLLIAA